MLLHISLVPSFLWCMLFHFRLYHSLFIHCVSGLLCCFKILISHRVLLWTSWKKFFYVQLFTCSLSQVVTIFLLKLYYQSLAWEQCATALSLYIPNQYLILTDVWYFCKFNEHSHKTMTSLWLYFAIVITTEVGIFSWILDIYFLSSTKCVFLSLAIFFLLSWLLFLLLTCLNSLVILCTHSLFLYVILFDELKLQNGVRFLNL